MCDRVLPPAVCMGERGLSQGVHHAAKRVPTSLRIRLTVMVVVNPFCWCEAAGGAGKAAKAKPVAKNKPKARPLCVPKAKAKPKVLCALAVARMFLQDYLNC